MNNFPQWLKDNGACEEARQWVGDRSLTLDLLRSCERADWRAWLAERLPVDSPLLAEMAKDAVRSVRWTVAKRLPHPRGTGEGLVLERACDRGPTSARRQPGP